MTEPTRPCPFPDPKTVRLKMPMLIHTHNYVPGDLVTLNRDRADHLVESGLADRAPLDLSRMPPAPGPRRSYLEVKVAVANPPPENAARISGRK